LIEIGWHSVVGIRGLYLDVIQRVGIRCEQWFFYKEKDQEEFFPFHSHSLDTDSFATSDSWTAPLPRSETCSRHRSVASWTTLCRGVNLYQDDRHHLKDVTSRLRLTWAQDWSSSVPITASARGSLWRESLAELKAVQRAQGASGSCWRGLRT